MGGWHVAIGIGDIVSKITSVNNASINGSGAIFILKSVLKTAGWTVPRSSDGTTYQAGDLITHASSGAGGMGNSYAWFVIQSPNGEHQWCFQRETNDDAEWRVKISPLDGFTGGTSSPIEVPSATDESIIQGGGTDAEPWMEDLFNLHEEFRWHVIAENVAVGTAVPIYGFWAFSTDLSGVPSTLISQEPMDPNTFPELSDGTRTSPIVGDPDPCAYVCKYLADNFKIELGWCWPRVVYAWYRFNYSGESWNAQYAAFFYHYNSSVYTCAPHTGIYGWGVNPYNGADEGVPITLGRPVSSPPAGLKGTCNFLRMKTVYREYPDTLNLSTDAMVYAGDLLIPWEDGTTPLV